MQFMGDGVGCDYEGFYWICGCVDDVVNVSGYCFSMVEIEVVFIEYVFIVEVVVVGVVDEFIGQVVNVFVFIKNGVEVDDVFCKDFIFQVCRSIGFFVVFKVVFVVLDFFKICSGKIMRCIFRKIFVGEEDQFGDISIFLDLFVVEKIINIVYEGKKK